MFGDERASAKEINLLLVRLQRQGSAVFETTKLETHVRMCSHPNSDFCKHQHYRISSQTSNFITIGQSVLEIWKRGVHVRTCGCTPPMTCGKHFGNGHPTYTPNLNTIGQAVPEIQKCGVHVCTCRDTPLVITACTTTNGTPIAYQISTQSAQPLPSSSRRSIYGKRVAHVRMHPNPIHDLGKALR